MQGPESASAALIIDLEEASAKALLIDTTGPMSWLARMQVDRGLDDRRNDSPVRVRDGELRIALRGHLEEPSLDRCTVRWGLARLPIGYRESLSFGEGLALCPALRELQARRGTTVVFEGPVLIPEAALEELRPQQVHVESEGEAAFFLESATERILALGERIQLEAEVHPDELDAYIRTACE